MSRSHRSRLPIPPLGLILAFLLCAIAGPAAALDLPSVAAEAGDYRQRLIEAYRIRTTPPPEAGELSHRAKQALVDGRWHDAIRIYQALLGQQPDDFGAWSGLAAAWSEFDAGTDSALGAAFNAYRVAPEGATRIDALRRVATVLEAQERWRWAIAAYEELAAMAPGDTEIAERRDWLRRQYGFRIADTRVEVDRDSPQICLQFSDDLRDASLVGYADFVRIAPETPVEILASGRDLCLEGVAHGQSYEITVLPGLPSRDGEVFALGETLTRSVDDREPRVAFRGGPYILPTSGVGTAPMTTVNVSSVALRFLRINDRSLVDQILDQRIGRPLDGYDVREIVDSRGEEVWTGAMDVDRVENRAVTTGVPIGEILAEIAPDPDADPGPGIVPSIVPGIYILVGRDADEDEEQPWQTWGTQWLVISDLGLATFSGADGVHVAVRSLTTGEAVAGVDVRLLARNNRVLGETASDGDGIASFPAGVSRGTGGNRPAAALALTPEGDFNFVELTEPAFDLSDRGVAGRAEPGPVDAYLFTERGVYRPGETVELVALLRNETAFALSDLPLTVRVRRPDGLEVDRVVMTDQGSGSYHWSLELSDSARSGTWTFEALTDPEDDAVGRATFQVEDFVPLRIRLALGTQSDAIRPSAATSITADAQYLYGAPAADLPGEAEAILRVDPQPWPDWTGYGFGLVQESFDPQRISLRMPQTGADGTSRVTVAIDSLPDTSLPLQAEIRATVFDMGGRPVNEAMVLPVRPDRPWIGLRSRFGDQLEREGTAAFDVIALDGEGQRIALSGATFQLVREIYDYQWYLGGSGWDYRVVVRDRPITSGSIPIAADAPALVEEVVDWGRYRLDVFDTDSGAASSVRFTGGWWVSPVVSDTPDTMDVTLDQPVYRDGDTARIHLDPTFAGEALVVVANDRMRHRLNVQVPDDGVTVEVPVSAEWGVGAYVLATAFRPATDAEARGPGRAVGVAWLDLDLSERTLDVALDAPDQVRPRGTVDVAIEVDGLEAGQRGHVTLAAVDEGILLLTDYASPDPVAHYYGQRALGIDLRDVYGRLIVSAGERGRIRSGGDGDQLRSLRVHVERTVALFSGIVELDEDGRAVVPVTIPDFNGELRLMATAWTGDAVGASEQSLTVRDPVVARVALPRFLAPGDSALIRVGLHNVDGAAGSYSARLTATGATTLAEPFAVTRDFAADERFSATARLTGKNLGIGTLALEISGPDGFAVEREWQIEVRPAQTFATSRLTGVMRPDQALVLDRGLADTYLPDTAEIAASFSTRPAFDVPGLVRELDVYPYGCLEQTVSRALPMIYLADVADQWGGDYRPNDIGRRVQQAVNRVITMQLRDGSFSLWSPFGQGEAWLSAYAMDFLTRAREEGYDLPDAAYRQGLSYLDDYVNRWATRDQCPAASAYALYVLARSQTADLADLRYYADTCLERYDTPIARGQIAAALASYGEVERADRSFAAATAPRIVLASFELRDYGSSLRDRAAMVALMAEAGWPLDAILAEADIAADEFAQARWTSTQEKAWLLLAAHALLEDQEEMILDIDGTLQPATRSVVTVTPDEAALARGMRIDNRSDGPVRRIVTARGIPAEPQPPQSNGFRLSRSYLDLDGNAIDPRTDPVRQNDLVVVLIRGMAETDIDHQALIVDLLPAGFEIENPRIGDGRSTEDVAEQLGLTAVDHIEMRDDRFVAAIDMNGSYREFAVAYLVRAVTPGTFTLPAAFVEDMYKPQYHARTAMGEITIHEPE